MAVLGGTTNPLAVADDEVAELTFGIELVEEAIGIVGPRHELELHVDAGFGCEVLAELDQRICRIPGRPAKSQLLCLRSRDGQRGNSDSET
jgi:hypothetical protein